MPENHSEHWKEPTAVTAERPGTDKFCETCGTKIPYHKASCGMLKNAHKRRYGKCTFCEKEFLVGQVMHDHVEEKHFDEMTKLLYS